LLCFGDPRRRRDGYDYGDGGFRQDGRRGGPPLRGQRQQRQRQRQGRDSPYYDDLDDGGDGEGWQERRRDGLGGGGGGGYDYGYDYGYDEFDDIGAGAGRRRKGRRSPNNARRGKKGPPELSPAERYERDIFGGLDGGGTGAGAGARGDGRRDEEDGDKIWTGVGPDGPWPT